MALTINHNLMAMNTARNLGTAYGGMSTSVQRLSSGLRVGTAADDAAGLAIRELMRADIKAINQGVRNANDAISMIQVADGALGVIDEKLIRMKELAMQASTGTYSSDQRIIIDSEFQAMKSEIDRIARATDFNGIHLLNGSLSTVTSRPAYLDGMLAHYTFDGTLVDSEGGASVIAHNNVTLNAGDARIVGSAGDYVLPARPAGGYLEVPQVDWGAVDDFTLSISIQEDDITQAANQVSYVTYSNLFVGIHRDHNTIQFRAGANVLNVPFVSANDQGKMITWTMTLNSETFSVYKDGSLVAEDTTPATLGSPNPIYAGEHNIGLVYWTDGGRRNAARFIGNVDDYRIYTKALSESDIQALNNGAGERSNSFVIDDNQVDVHFGPGNDAKEDFYSVNMKRVDSEALGIRNTEINTQEQAQGALAVLDQAIIHKDNVRANLGAMQNRLENTITNLSIQAENLQASESRISDADVSQEMTELVREQILAQSATAMLAQANSFPKMALQLIQG